MSKETAPDLEALKARMKATWMAGDFGQVAKHGEPEAEKFITRQNIKPGTRLLDVACGTGNLAIPAAQADAIVTGIDIAPNLLEQTGKRAKSADVKIRLNEGNATETTPGVAPAKTQNRWTRSEAGWKDVIRPYAKEEVERLRGTLDTPRPYERVRFLEALMPRKPLAELYTTIGYHKHGKTEFYRDFLRHLEASEDQFEKAEGDRGMVMVVFTLPSNDLVFKLIKDRFDHPKNSSRSEVMRKYRLFFEHDRAGRLVEACEFEHLRIPRDRFRAELLEELQGCAADSVSIEDEYVLIKHLYVQRRVRPLNLYLAETDEPAARAAVIDYGQAIKDLAATNIFPGDLLPKNFGVTRHGSVVFYDYDELCWVTDCDFRELPAPTSYEEEIAAEPWFSVHENDIFPEEFPRFLGFRPDLLETLVDYHADLFQPVAWRRAQTALRAGNITEIFSYGADKRLLGSPEHNTVSPVATDVRPPTGKNALAGHSCATASVGKSVNRPRI